MTKYNQADKMKIEKRKILKVDSGGNLKEVEISKKTKGEEGYDAFKYLGLGYYILIPLLFAVILGVFVDKVLGTKPVFSLVFIIFGSIATFYNLIKLVKDGENSAH